MRKLLLLSALVFLFAVPSFAVFHLGISGGYTYSSLAELNDYWEEIKADAAANTLVAAPNWTGYGNGVFANGDLNFNLNPNFLIGVRSGIQYIFPSTYAGYRLFTDPTDVWVPTETSNYDFLIPIMGGFCLYLPLGDAAMGLRLEAYGGWGLGYCAQSTSYDGSTPLLSLYSGGGFMADISGAIEFKILPFFTVSVNGGYRFAKMSDFKTITNVSATVPGYGSITIPTNDPLSDGSGNPVAVDFTGFNIGAGINIRI